jgi:hypothetical protein
MALALTAVAARLAGDPDERLTTSTPSCARLPSMLELADHRPIWPISRRRWSACVSSGASTRPVVAGGRDDSAVAALEDPAIKAFFRAIDADHAYMSAVGASDDRCAPAIPAPIASGVRGRSG